MVGKQVDLWLKYISLSAFASWQLLGTVQKRPDISIITIVWFVVNASLQKVFAAAWWSS